MSGHPILLRHYSEKVVADEVAVEKKSKKDKKKKKDKVEEETMEVDLPGASIAYVRSASRVDGC